MKALLKVSWQTVIIILIMVIFTSCANKCEQVNHYSNVMEDPLTYNFLGGLLHGAIMPFAFFASLISDTCVEMYASNHVEGWYDFGYMIGVIFSIGAGIKGSESLKKN